MVMHGRVHLMHTDLCRAPVHQRKAFGFLALETHTSLLIRSDKRTHSMRQHSMCEGAAFRSVVPPPSFPKPRSSARRCSSPSSKCGLHSNIMAPITPHTAGEVRLTTCYPGCSTSTRSGTSSGRCVEKPRHFHPGFWSIGGVFFGGELVCFGPLEGCFFGGGACLFWSVGGVFWGGACLEL